LPPLHRRPSSRLRRAGQEARDEAHVFGLPPPRQEVERLLLARLEVGEDAIDHASRRAVARADRPPGIARPEAAVGVARRPAALRSDIRHGNSSDLDKSQRGLESYVTISDMSRGMRRSQSSPGL